AGTDAIDTLPPHALARTTRFCRSRRYQRMLGRDPRGAARDGGAMCLREPIDPGSNAPVRDIDGLDLPRLRLVPVRPGQLPPLVRDGIVPGQVPPGEHIARLGQRPCQAVLNTGYGDRVEKPRRTEVRDTNAITGVREPRVAARIGCLHQELDASLA